jgi:hypothetical protein
MKRGTGIAKFDRETSSAPIIYAASAPSSIVGWLKPLARLPWSRVGGFQTGLDRTYLAVPSGGLLGSLKPGPCHLKKDVAFALGPGSSSPILRVVAIFPS